ncbi:MAG TPA: MauE/DoxX family redox-associated membrane protein [Gemmataceae bacterium]|nr:MauE/DoxX family redox-associated membrane protein [Gemmataceae bacterium]
MAKPAALLCGLMLLAAGTLKLYGLNLSPFAQYGRLLTPTVQSVAVAWEILLGVWLLSGVSRFLAWVAAILTFTAFAGISGYLGLIGQANCGCFGIIRASPWAAFAVDISALTLLTIGRPTWGNWAAHRGGLRWLGGLSAILVVLSGLSIVVFGSLDAAMAKLRGERVSIIPEAVDLGDGKSGEPREFSVVLVNRTDQTIRIIGTNLGCSCSLTRRLPIDLPPNEPTTIGLRVQFPNGAGNYGRRVLLLTNNDLQPFVVIQFTGKVRDG